MFVKLRATKSFSNGRIGYVDPGDLFDCPQDLAHHLMDEAKVAVEIPGVTYGTKVMPSAPENKKKENTSMNGLGGGQAPQSPASPADPALNNGKSMSFGGGNETKAGESSLQTPPSSKSPSPTSSTPATDAGGNTRPRVANKKRSKKSTRKRVPKSGRKTRTRPNSSD